MIHGPSICSMTISSQDEYSTVLAESKLSCRICAVVHREMVEPNQTVAPSDQREERRIPGSPLVPSAKHGLVDCPREPNEPVARQTLPAVHWSNFQMPCDPVRRVSSAVASTESSRCGESVEHRAAIIGALACRR